MCIFTRGKSLRKVFLLLSILVGGGNFWVAAAQTKVVARRGEKAPVSVIPGDKAVTEKPLVASVLPNYYDAQAGLSALDLISRALAANGELVAARLEIEKARARLVQAGLRPNPTLEIEQTSGRFLGSPGEGDFSVGATLPLELYGQSETSNRAFPD